MMSQRFRRIITIAILVGMIGMVLISGLSS